MTTVRQLVNNLELFDACEHYVDLAELGYCEIVAIHQKDESTERQYRGYCDSTLLTVKCAEYKWLGQKTIMVDNDTPLDESHIEEGF